MITYVPARIMRLEHRKGVLAAGMDADVIIFDKNINIEEVIIAGRLTEV